eukprot:gene21937-biopygen7680
MPMGKVPAPEVMHRVTTALAEEAARGLPVITGAFIDDMRFLGSKSDLVAAGLLCRIHRYIAEEERSGNDYPT